MRVRAIALLAAALLASAASAQLTLTQRQEATVAGDRVMLGDVAELAGEPAELVTRLATLDLGQAPAPGTHRAVTRRFLAVRLKQERLEAPVRLAGAEATQVSRLATRLSGRAIADAAAEQLRSVLPWPDDDLIIEVRRAPADLHLTGDAEGLRFTLALSPGQRLLGTVPATVTVSREGSAVARTTTLLHVRVFQRVLVARRRIRTGEPITKDAVQVQRMELTSMTSDALTDLADVLGQEARQEIRPFAVLTRRMLTPARVVRRGDVVTLLAQSARLRVTALGIAEQDGAVGQLIRVRNRDSSKVVLGRVLDSETVRVPF